MHRPTTQMVHTCIHMRRCMLLTSTHTHTHTYKNTSTRLKPFRISISKMNAWKFVHIDHTHAHAFFTSSRAIQDQQSSDKSMVTRSNTKQEDKPKDVSPVYGNGGLDYALRMLATCMYVYIHAHTHVYIYNMHVYLCARVCAHA